MAVCINFAYWHGLDHVDMRSRNRVDEIHLNN
jgi:hypothetical protein